MAVGVMLDYHVEARGGVATTKQAEIVLDTDRAGRRDTFNPVAPGQSRTSVVG